MTQNKNVEKALMSFMERQSIDRQMEDIKQRVRKDMAEYKSLAQKRSQKQLVVDQMLIEMTKKLHTDDKTKRKYFKSYKPNPLLLTNGAR